MYLIFFSFFFEEPATLENLEDTSELSKQLSDDEIPNHTMNIKLVPDNKEDKGKYK